MKLIIALTLLSVSLATQAVTPEPTTISVPPKTTDIITLTWNPNPGVTPKLLCSPDCFWYAIYMIQPPATTPIPIWSGTDILVKIDTIDLGLTNGFNEICFKVRAANQYTFSNYSDQVCTTVVMGKPLTPLGVQVVYP